MRVRLAPVLAAAFVLAGCAVGPTPSATSSGSEVFIAAQVDDASYVDGTFTIDGLDAGVVLVTMAPERRAWNADASEIPGLFGDATLNTVIVADGAEHALALSAPVYDAVSGAVTFAAAPIDADALQGGTLEMHGDALTPATAGSWGAASVFIDPIDYNPCTLGIVADLYSTQLMVRSSLTPPTSSSYANVPAPYLSNNAPDYGISATSGAFLDCSDGTPSVTYDVYRNSIYYEPAGVTPSWQYNTKLGSATFAWDGSKAVCTVTSVSDEWSPHCIRDSAGTFTLSTT